jgi:hypothetical protein
MLNKDYENELQDLKPHDEVQFSSICEFSGYLFITTAGHGYLVVPRNDANALHIKPLEYGYIGKLAYYLEEDCEAPEFIKYLNGTKKAVA